MKRSVILTDRLDTDILLMLRMKRQLLHRERAHFKVPGCSLVLSALLTKKLATFLFLSCIVIFFTFSPVYPFYVFYPLLLVGYLGVSLSHTTPQACNAFTLIVLE